MKNKASAVAKIPIIYILSSPRSGSTLLEIMLNGHQEIRSIGEVRRLDEALEEDWFCSCGISISQCGFWQKIESSMENMTETYYDPLSFYKRHLSAIIYPNRQEAQYYALPSYNLFKAILGNTSAKIIVDSSKAHWRLIYLMRSGLFDVKVIHLIRNGKAVLNSRKKVFRRPQVDFNDKTRAQPSWKSSIRWIARNLIAHKISRFIDNGKYSMIFYEDLAKHPENVMRKICKDFGLSYERALIEPEIKDFHHLGGSRWVYQKNGPLRIQYDESWMSQLVRKDEIVFNIVAGWLNRYYGY